GNPDRSWGCRRLSCAPSFLDLDGGDADRRRRLAVTAVPAIVLPTLEFHDGHLSAAALGHDLARHLRAAERLLARDDLAVARDEEDGTKLDRRSLLARHLLDGDELARRHAVLLPPGRDHGFHVRPFFVCRLWRAPMSAQAGALRRAPIGAAPAAGAQPAAAWGG